MRAAPGRVSDIEHCAGTDEAGGRERHMNDATRAGTEQSWTSVGLCKFHAVDGDVADVETRAAGVRERNVLHRRAADKLCSKVKSRGRDSQDRHYPKAAQNRGLRTARVIIVHGEIAEKAPGCARSRSHVDGTKRAGRKHSPAIICLAEARGRSDAADVQRRVAPACQDQRNRWTGNPDWLLGKVHSTQRELSTRKQERPAEKHAVRASGCAVRNVHESGLLAVCRGYIARLDRATAAGAIVAPQSFVCVKGPLVEMPERLIAPLPGLLRVMLWGALVVPRSCGAKVSVKRLNCRAGPAPAPSILATNASLEP